MNLIYSCDIQNLNNSTMQTLELYEGFDANTIESLQESWAKENTKRLQVLIDKKNNEQLTIADIKQLLDENHFNDAGWNYQTKALHYNSGNYTWVYAIINGHIEAVCIINHPKNSRIDAQDIFYVEYLAVAPWNRNTMFGARKYKGLGTKILSACSKEFNAKLKYRCGFSLHSLAQAFSYYISIGMQDFGIDPDKENLNYLEMNAINAKKLIIQNGV